MDPRFPAWYIAAALDPKDEFLRKRWTAVTDFSSSISQASALELVRIFHRMAPADAGFVGRFEAAIQKHDAGFSAGAHHQELPVLAAAIITELHKTPSEIADVTSLAVTAYHCQGAGSPGAVPGIVELHREYLIQRSQDQRSGIVDTEFLVVPSALDDTINKAKEEDDALVAIGQVTDGLQHIHRTLIQMGNRMRVMEKRDSLFREESNVLWWMTGGYSRDLDKPLANFKNASVCIIVGKELADLAAEVAGPYAAPAFLNRILINTDEKLLGPTALASAVNPMDASWIKRFVGDGFVLGAEAFCPITLALAEYLRSGKNWTQMYKSMSPVNHTAKISGHDLACQMYRECLLLKQMRKTSGGA